MEEEEAARVAERSGEGIGEGTGEGTGEGGAQGEGKGSAEGYADGSAEGSAEAESGIGGYRDPSGKRSTYAVPSQICPDSNKSCCFIKMQDPCAPCCCETEPKLPPCPPKYGPQEPRQPTCDCDLCQKDPNNNKCCDKNRAFRGISLDARYFEKA
ncbi:uncharacterized protein LOC144473890 [Augochlora pura]